MKRNGAKLRDFPEKKPSEPCKKMTLPTNSNFLVCHTISVQIVGMQHDVKIENLCCVVGNFAGNDSPAHSAFTAA